MAICLNLKAELYMLELINVLLSTLLLLMHNLSIDF